MFINTQTVISAINEMEKKNTLTDDKTKRVSFYVGLFIPCHISLEKKTLQFSQQKWKRKEFRASVDWLQYGIHFSLLSSIPENVQSQYLFEKQWRWSLRPTSLAPCFQLLSTNELIYPVLIHITHFSKPHRYVSSPANTVIYCAKTLFDFSLFGDNYKN